MEIKNSSSSEEKKKMNKSKSNSSNIKSDSSNKSNTEEEEHLINYFTFINNSSTKLEENRQSYFNKLSELKSQIENTKAKSVDYLMFLISEFITLCDTYYASFEEQKKILVKFNELNDSAQNINFLYEKANYSNLYFKESNKKLLKQYNKIQKENQNIRQILQEMNTSQNKSIEENEIKNNTEKEMKNKMKKVMEENIELKQRCSQILSESKIFKNYADEKFINEQENNKRMSTLINKLETYEDTIGKMQKKITQYENERQRANTENKEKDLRNRTISMNLRYENENMINLDTNKSELSDNISIKQGINLEELLLNQNEFEDEEKLSKNINISINNEINQIKNNSEKKSERSDSVKRYNDYDIDAEIDMGPNFLNLCPIKKLDKKKYKKEKNSVNNNIYKSPFSKSQNSLIIKNKKYKNAKSVINSGNNFSKNYNKIFFFLLLKAIIINRNIKEFYKKHDFDILYEECQNDRIPFNLYEEWIMNKFKINDNNAINSIINDCFICSSII